MNNPNRLSARIFLILSLGLPLFLIQCGRTGKVGSGRYEVADQEYSSQNYSMQRQLTAQGGFEEKHVVDHCLLMEMTGKWLQKGGILTLRYDQIRNRATCHDSLGAWAVDTSQLTVPIRNVEGTSYESLLAASGDRPEKWIKWLKTE
ncbi:MAG: hypothetical protein ABIW76_06665 [Fibrobacteria bacterium]